MVPAAPDSLVVALDNPGDFCSVQGSIDAIPAANATPVKVTLKNGTYREIVRPSKIVMSWKWENEDADTLVTLSFRAVDGKTELTLKHQGFTAETRRDEGSPARSRPYPKGSYPCETICR